MKRILSTLSQKWPEYLIEAIVIIASILGAYSLDNWNEERNIRKSEQVILQNLKREVISNIDQLKMAQAQRQVSHDCGVEMLKLFGKDVSGIPPLRLDTLLSNIEFVWTFEQRDGFMKSIIASGKIDNLRNDELKSMITSFEGFVTDATQETSHLDRLLHERLWPKIDGKINSSNRLIAGLNQNLPVGAYTSDFTWFFQSRETEDIISNMVSWMISIQTDEQELMDFLKQMLKIIDQELAKATS